jgi:uridine kinase
MDGTDVCIVEGTYVSVLQTIDLRIFIDRTYNDTLEDRHSRSRDYMDEFTEKVLEVEHQIIQKHRDKADIVIDKSFNVNFIKVKSK